MIFTIANQETYVPKFNGNRKLKKEDQCSVVIGFPSVTEIAENAKETGNGALFNFLIYVKSIKNFKVEVNGEVRDGTVRDILELAGLSELFSEIKEQYEKLTTVNKKK